MNRPLRERWQELADSYGDRQALPAFVGRDAMIERIFSIAQLPPGSGRTFILEGAPGAGKTALHRALTHIAREAGIEVLSMRAMQDPLAEGDLIPRLVHALDPERETPSAHTIQTALRARLNAGIRIDLFEQGVDIGIGGDGDRTTIRAQEKDAYPGSIIGVEHEYVTALGKNPKLADRRVLLLIDEAHLLEDRSKAVMSQLHTVEDLPLLTVLTGTPKLSERLRPLGLYRNDKRNHLLVETLTPQEARDAVADNIRKGSRIAGHPIDPEPSHIGTLAQASNGWPQHVACYLRGLWETMARNDSTQIDDRAIDEAVRIGNRHKTAYCEERMAWADIHCVLAETALATCERAPGRSAPAALVRHTMSKARALLDSEEQEALVNAHGGTPADWIPPLVHNGVLSISPERRRSVRPTPIPSLRSHIQEEVRQLFGDESIETIARIATTRPSLRIRASAP